MARQYYKSQRFILAIPSFTISHRLAVSDTPGMISQGIIGKELFNDVRIKYYAVDIATQREMMNFGAKRRSG